MPRIHEGSKKRFGTAESKAYTRVTPNISAWASYDAGLTKEPPSTLAMDAHMAGKVTPRPSTSKSRPSSRSSRRRRRNVDAVLLAIEDKYDYMAKNEYQPPTTTTPMVSPEEINSAFPVTLAIMAPLHIVGGKHCPITIDDVMCNTAINYTTPAHTTNRSRLKQKTIPSPGDKVFDESDVQMDSQIELEQWRKTTNTFSQLEPVLDIKDIQDSQTSLEMSDKERYFREITIAPVPVLPSVNPGTSTLYQQHQGVINQKIRWNQFTPTTFSIEHISTLESDGTVADKDVLATCDLRWEAHILKKLNHCSGIPNPTHFVVSEQQQVSLHMECRKNYPVDLFGTLEEFLYAHQQYNQGGVPELVTAWLTVEIITIISQIHKSGVTHNTIGSESFLLARKHDTGNWCLLITGFGANASTENNAEGSFVSDLYCVAQLVWTILSGGIPFSYIKRRETVELDRKEFITSNRFLRGSLAWEELLQVLLNPPSAHQGVHSMEGWTDLSQALDLIKMMAPPGNTPAPVATYFDSLMSHRLGNMDCFTREQPIEEFNTAEIERKQLKQLIAQYNVKYIRVKQENVELKATINHERTHLLQRLNEKHMQDMKVLDADVIKARRKEEEQMKEIVLLREKIMTLDELLASKSAKLKECISDKKLLDCQIIDLKEELHQSREREADSSLHGQLRVLQHKLLENEQHQRSLQLNVGDLTTELQRWRLNADRIRCKALELQQEEVQLNRVRASLWQASVKHAVRQSPKAISPKLPKESRSRKRSAIDMSSPETLKKMSKNPPLNVNEPAVPFLSKNETLGPLKKRMGRKHIRFAGGTQTIVADDPYSMNSDTD